jgi:drug/metabolite transporter (DMT)-like permease
VITISSDARTQLRGTLLVTLSGMLFGMMGFTGTRLFDFNFSVENMLFWRFLIATLCIFFSILLFGRNIRKPAVNSSSIIKIFILGGLTYSGASGFYFLASKHIGTGLAMVIFFSFPVFVTLFAWTLGTWKMNKLALMALLAVVTGLFLLKGSGENTLDEAGILLAIIAACCFAAYVYGSQHTTKQFDSRLLALLVCCANTLIFLVLSLYTNTFIFPSSLHAWWYVCAIAVIATALPIQLLLDGLKYISPVKASILSALEPVVTVLIGLMFLNESMSYTQTAGVMVVLLGAVLIQFERKPKLQ